VPRQGRSHCISINMLAQYVEKSTRILLYSSGSVDYEDTLNEEIHSGEWRNSSSSTGMQSLAQQGSNRYSLDAKSVRDELQ
jgi:hypothetical protein